MANVQLGNLGIYGFRADLFGNYDFFDESYDLSTTPTPSGVRLYRDFQNYTELKGSGIQYVIENGEIYGFSSGTITGFTQVTDGYTIFDISDLDVSAAVVNELILSGSPEQGFRYILSGNDTITGSDLSDTLFGGAGTNTLNGRSGTDTALYQGNAADYQISFNPDGSIGVIGAQSADTLISIERVRFDDGALALDTDGIAGQAYRIYQAAFDRTPDGAGLSYWIKAMDDGVSLIDVATGFVGSQEFANVYGASPTNEVFVEKLYENVLGRAGETGGVSFWVSQLNQGKSQAQVLADFSESPENVQGVAPAIADGIWIY